VEYPRPLGIEPGLTIQICNCGLNIFLRFRKTRRRSLTRKNGNSSSLIYLAQGFVLSGMSSSGHSPLASESCGSSIRPRSSKHMSQQFKMRTARATTTNINVGGDHRGAARHPPTKPSGVYAYTSFRSDPHPFASLHCTSTLPSVISSFQSSAYAYSSSEMRHVSTCHCLRRHTVYLQCTSRSPNSTFVS